VEVPVQVGAVDYGSLRDCVKGLVFYVSSCLRRINVGEGHLQH
jgi:hypothetical protein